MTTETFIIVGTSIVLIILISLIFFLEKTDKIPAIPVRITTYSEEFETILAGISLSQSREHIMRQLCETFKFQRKWQNERTLGEDVGLLMEVSRSKIEDLKI